MRPSFDPRRVRSLLGLAATEQDPVVERFSTRLLAEDGASWLDRALSSAAQRDSDPARLSPDANADGELSTAVARVAQLLDGAELEDRELAGGAGAQVDEALLLAVAEAGSRARRECALQVLQSLSSAGRPEGRSEGPVGGRRTIGGFALEEPLGEGSSGVVFRARDLDTGAPAAVKLLRLDALAPDQVARFRNEARIASSLDHPGIVNVLDSGVDDDRGVMLPWIATVLVEGKPLAEWVREQPLRAVLEVFAKVCDAVAHAHARGVVHRDLNPRNILVDTQGEPRVLDFGIAKQTRNDTAPPTQSGVLLGTPGFMSPEVARRGAIAAGPTSDVWSLGAVLFYALAGQPPHDIRGLSAPEVLRRAAEDDPRRIEDLRGGLPRALTTILASATAPEPRRRYATAAELAADVRRFLSGQTILARRRGIVEDVARFTRRHRPAVAAAGLSVLALTLGGTLSAVMWQRSVAAEATARDATSRSFDAVLATVRMTAELSESTHSSRALLAHIASTFDALDEVREPGAEWDRIEAELREVGGDVALRNWDWDTATLHRDRALALQRQLAAQVGAPTADLARALVKRGDLEKDRNRFDGARPYYLEAHEIFQALSDADPLDATALNDLCWSYERCAYLDEDGESRVRSAQVRYRLSQRLLQLRGNRADVHNHAGAILFVLRQHDRLGADRPGQVDLALEGVDCVRQILADAPQRRVYRILAVHCFNQLSREYRLEGAVDDALAAGRRAIANAERLCAEDSQDSMYHLVAMTTLAEHARLEAEIGEIDQVLPILERALLMERSLGKPDLHRCQHVVSAMRESMIHAAERHRPDTAERLAILFGEQLRRMRLDYPDNSHTQWQSATWFAQYAPAAQRSPARALAELAEFDRCVELPRDEEFAEAAAQLYASLGAVRECEELRARIRAARER